MRVNVDKKEFCLLKKRQNSDDLLDHVSKAFFHFSKLSDTKPKEESNNAPT
jgi:hypothetical protein